MYTFGPRDPVLLNNVMDDLGRALETIPGLRVFPYWTRSIHPPAAIVGWPDPLNYDATMGRGSDRCEIPVMIAVGNVDSRSARDVLAAYMAGSGANSIKTVLEAHLPGSYDSCRVTRVDVAVMTINSVDYLSATFRVDIIGKGA